MDKNIKEYREKHPNCKWCKYHKYRYKCEWDWEECILKDKWLNILFNKIRALFCKYYTIEEEENKDD